MSDSSQDVLKLSLSILLSAAVAHVLYILAITIDDNNTFIWFIFTFVIILITIALILYISGVNIKFEKDKKIDPTNFFKTILIMVVTIDIFSIIRFFYFWKNNIINNIESSYQLIWFIAFGACAVLSGLIISEFKKDRTNARWIILLVITIILTILFISLIASSNTILTSMGVLK